jgi:hypothetical protein
LPVPFWAALAVLTVGFAATIAGRTRISGAVPAGYVLGLIAILHATPALVYPNLRYAWTWKHVSIVDVLASRHWLPNVPESTALAAYSRWPGFFTPVIFQDSDATVYRLDLQSVFAHHKGLS